MHLAPIKPSQDTARILAIDDEERMLQAYQDLLSRRGYGVQTLSSAEEGLRYLECQTCDLILLDLYLPGMDGVEFLKRCRRPRHVPVVVVSAYATLENTVKVMKLGACEVVPKPYDPEDLLQLIDQVLTLHRDPLIAYIQIHFAEIDSREAVARRFGISPGTVSNRIKHYTYQSFHDFLQSCRVQAAQWLLAETGLEIKQIFPRVGFHSRRTLDRAFRRLAGRSPRQYRQEQRALRP